VRALSSDADDGLSGDERNSNEQASEITVNTMPTGT
jgi:hypothetical protein